MDIRLYQIGELARLSGVSVRRIRFYSDQGLLPVPHRTDANYRAYTPTDLARLDLIRALRAAGIGLAMIRKILVRSVSLKDVLEARLGALEIEIARQRRLAAALRATLAHDPSEVDLKRFMKMMTLSEANFRDKLEGFFDRLTEGIPTEEKWKQQMRDAATPELPDDPTPGQIDAWNELVEMLNGVSYLAELREGLSAMSAFNQEAYGAAVNNTLTKIRAALATGSTPDSPAGRAVAREWLERSAAAMKRRPDADFLKWHRTAFARHLAHSARYQELMAVLRGGDPAGSAGREWRWMCDAIADLEHATD
jgi:DNA-binding transcriptional MerR regulator